MIILRYKGGLGNQMFIYAMELALKKHYPEVEIMADTTRYLLHNEHNGYEIPTVWGFAPIEAPKEKIKNVSPYFIPGDLLLHSPNFIKEYVCNSYQHKYYEKHKDFSKYKHSYYKQDDHQVYDAKIWDLNTDSDLYLDGLWQNLAYFDDVEDEIKKAFSIIMPDGQSRFEDKYTLEDLTWCGQIKDSESVSLHVRRGDFANSKFDICGPDYYRKAIEELTDRTGKKLEELHFFLFTDDVDYVNEAFGFLPQKTTIHHDVTISYLDMDFMSRCRHHIISNSTFSWWGAWLAVNTTPDCITVAPKYSLYKQDKYYPMSVPANWVQIEV